MVSNRLKYGALLSFVIAMAVLLIGGLISRNKLAPYFGKLLSREDGSILADKATILRGQAVYQKYGLMDHGGVWGHGTQRGMDFSAHSLHLIGVYMRDYYSNERYGKAYDALDSEQTSIINAIVVNEIKKNNYDKNRDV